MKRTCGNHKIKCPYMTGDKFCKRPREYKCNYIIEKFKREGLIK